MGHRSHCPMCRAAGRVCSWATSNTGVLRSCIAPGKGGLLVSMAKQPDMNNVAARIATFRICISYH